MTIAAVLTGDLVASTSLTSTVLSTALKSLQEMSNGISGWPQIGHGTYFTRSRGDGWQIVLDRPELALRAALYLQSGLISRHDGLQSRIAIATGDVILPQGGDLNAASGPVFTASGRALDALDDTLLIHAAGGALGAAVRLADHLAQGWTVAQARATHAMLALPRPTHTQVAARAGVTRQAIDKALRSAGFPALDAALALIEGTAQDAP